MVRYQHWALLSYKLTRLGFMLNTLVFGESFSVVQMKLCEGKEIDGKKYMMKFGATTGTTLHLLEPYFYKGRVVIGDTWSESFKPAV